MVNVLISGAMGKMGKKVFDAIGENPNTTAVCGVDRLQDLSNLSYPIYSSFSSVEKKVDVVIDFSVKDNLDNVLDFCIKNNVGAVLCTTGYSNDDIVKIENASKKVAIFRSSNMSVGVNVLIELVKKATKSLYGFDIEIVEKHHNQKVDAPSGTALMIADAIKEERKDSLYVYGRNGVVGKRKENEIGIHALRGGNIVGEHEVMFAGLNETLTLSHQATDRSVFAIGAINASIYISSKKNGLYNMSDMINGK